MTSRIAKRLFHTGLLALALGLAGCEVKSNPTQEESIPGTPRLPEVAKMDIQADGPGLGKAVYTKWCSICHSDGPGYPGTVALTERYKGTEISGVLLKRTDLDPDFIKGVVRGGLFNMPNFRKTEISDAELDALANYLASSK
ncbi:c-type cytochrome [Novosphingobium pentaromativorans]|nr:cytochrome c [Novosphingobium pentaromativorans]